MLKHSLANRKRRLSALPNVGPYIYTTLKFLALQGATYIYDISRLRVNQQNALSNLQYGTDRKLQFMISSIPTCFGSGFSSPVSQTEQITQVQYANAGIDLQLIVF
jgi:hypothetical protein